MEHIKIVAADDFGADYASKQSNLVRDMGLDPVLSSAIDYYGFGLIYLHTCFFAHLYHLISVWGGA